MLRILGSVWGKDYVHQGSWRDAVAEFLGHQGPVDLGLALEKDENEKVFLGAVVPDHPGA